MPEERGHGGKTAADYTAGHFGNAVIARISSYIFEIFRAGWVDIYSFRK